MRNYDYDEPTAAAADPEPDPRVVAMQKVVDAEQRAQYAQRDADERQKRAAVLAEELSEARDELNGLLGLPSRHSQKSVGINISRDGYDR